MIPSEHIKHKPAYSLPVQAQQTGFAALQRRGITDIKRRL
jgi:hypothetical protein